MIALVEENCTVCMLCARECPDWCIYIDSHKEEGGGAYGGGLGRGSATCWTGFAIDFSLCMYCGICVEVCPFDALFWISTSSKASGDTQAAGGSAPDVECPGISVRTGAATLMIGSKPGEEPSALDLRYQVTIVRTARECQVNSGIMTMKVGVEGRVITGPAGGPGTVNVPIRLAVVQEGVNPKTIMSRFASVEVVVAGSVDRVPFVHVDPEISFPLPQPMSNIDAYVVYVGFIPRGRSRKEERNLRASRSRERPPEQIRAKTEKASQCDGLRAFTIAI